MSLQADPKWKERKEALEAVLPLAQSTKLVPGEYGELMKALKKVSTIAYVHVHVTVGYMV